MMRETFSLYPHISIIKSQEILSTLQQAQKLKTPLKMKRISTLVESLMFLSPPIQQTSSGGMNIYQRFFPVLCALTKILFWNQPDLTPMKKITLMDQCQTFLKSITSGWPLSFKELQIPVARGDSWAYWKEDTTQQEEANALLLPNLLRHILKVLQGMLDKNLTWIRWKKKNDATKRWWIERNWRNNNC